MVRRQRAAHVEWSGSWCNCFGWLQHLTARVAQLQLERYVGTLSTCSQMVLHSPPTSGRRWRLARRSCSWRPAGRCGRCAQLPAEMPPLVRLLLCALLCPPQLPGAACRCQPFKSSGSTPALFDPGTGLRAQCLAEERPGADAVRRGAGGAKRPAPLLVTLPPRLLTVWLRIYGPLCEQAKFYARHVYSGVQPAC